MLNQKILSENEPVSIPEKTPEKNLPTKERLAALGNLRFAIEQANFEVGGETEIKWKDSSFVLEGLINTFVDFKNGLVDSKNEKIDDEDFIRTLDGVIAALNEYKNAEEDKREKKFEKAKDEVDNFMNSGIL